MTDTTYTFPAFPFHQHGGITASSMGAFLVHCARHNVSDIFLQGGGPIVISHYGRMQRASTFPLEPPALNRIIEELFSPDIPGTLRSGNGVDRALTLSGDINGRYGLGRGEVQRFRANFVQAHIGLEHDLREALLPHDGLGLVCGETGSGKSTLLASGYQRCQITQPHRKIITLEDPVEYLLEHPDAILMPEQQQIGRDIPSFSEGLRFSLRRAPGLIGIGEIRDGATLSGAMANAESGHMCLSTMHTATPGEALPRALRMLPAEQREAAAFDLLRMLRFIAVQRLLRTTDGCRQAVRSYIVFDDALRLELSNRPYQEWGAYIDARITRTGKRIQDRAWGLYQDGRIDGDELLTVMDWAELTKRQQEVH
jgi:defect in organelle trafficking protein DotB